jgi:dCMP deaminase
MTPSRPPKYIADWDEFFMRIAAIGARKSKDCGSQVGAVIVLDKQVISIGYNGLPRGVTDDIPSRLERPEKYLWHEHAERNAVYNAARVGSPTLGSSMYVTMHPCADCARAIVQAGVSRVVIWNDNPFNDGRWGATATVRDMFAESGTRVELMNMSADMSAEWK